MSAQPTWLNQKLADRLLKRIDRPGVAQPQMADGIATRLEQMALPQPLVDELADRWQSTLDLYDESAPLVLAQPVPQESAPLAPPQSPRKPRPKVASAKPIAKMSTPTATQPSLPQDVSPSDSKRVTSSPSKKSPRRTALPTQSSPRVEQAKNTISATVPQPSSSLVSVQGTKLPSANTSTSTAPLQTSELPAVQANVAPDKPSIGREKQLPNLAPAAGGQKATQIPNRGQTVATQAVAKRAAVKATSQSTMRPTTDGGSATPNMVLPPVVAPAPALQSTGRLSSQSVPAQPVARKSVQPIESPSLAPTPERSLATAASFPFTTSTPAPLSGLISSGQRVAGIGAGASVGTSASLTSSIIQRQPQGSLPLATAKAAPSVKMQAQPTNSPPKPKAMPARTGGPAANSGSSSNVIQRAPDPDAISSVSESSSAGASTSIASMSIEEIVEEVQRQFMRNVAIEGERRGATSWR